MPNIILLGAPGSGKGTQAIQLAQKLQVPAISTGDALRKEVENLSEIGKMAKSYMPKWLHFRRFSAQCKSSNYA